jgi:hypothetical protein
LVEHGGGLKDAPAKSHQKRGRLLGLRFAPC